MECYEGRRTGGLLFVLLTFPYHLYPPTKPVQQIVPWLVLWLSQCPPDRTYMMHHWEQIGNFKFTPAVIPKSKSVGFQSLVPGSGVTKMHAPDLVGNVLEPCWNPPGTVLELPNTDSVGFQSLKREVVPAKCMFRKTGTRSLAGTLLESHSWNLETDETLLEPC